MEIMSRILEKAPEHIRRKCQNTAHSYEEYLQKQCRTLNELPGNLDGVECPDCRNKGVIYLVQDSYLVHRVCSCMRIRDDYQRLRKSGLKNLIEEYTFERFSDRQPFQKKLKEGALRFLEDHDRKWFFAGGQPGAGKSHICTAIAAEFLERRVGVRYMLWCDASTRLKALVNEPEYMSEVCSLKTAEVLYIDDFFKTASDSIGNKKPPTPADIRLAFEILNYRYNNNGVTILSSERTIDEIIDCDEAVGSRIYQRTKDYCFVIGKDSAKNYRLTDDTNQR